MSNILITGGAGFVGQRLAEAVLKDSSVKKLVLVDVFEPKVPNNDSRVKPIKADLMAEAENLITKDLDVIFVLHGIMSGQSEQEFDLGMRVNLFATRKLLEVARATNPGIRIVFTSSCAVFGGEPIKGTITDFTYLNPQTSYGTEKAMCELLINDYSRRGFIDGRSVRLPTITVRQGKPSSAASSFASGVIREPLAGEECILPVPRDIPVWVCSPKTVVKNIHLASQIPAANFGQNRSVNLPGITVTVNDMISVLEKAKPGASKLIKDQRDEFQLKIVLGWAAHFDVERAYQIGFVPDNEFGETVTAFQKEMGYIQ